QNRNSQVVIDDVKSHIESFPKVESHYCRKSISKEYLEKGLNSSKMYTLYTEKDAKEIAKSIAESEPCVGAACFDLQQVMMLPKAYQTDLFLKKAE
ncbi:hypothetical protein MAR_018788, partial [Mya arenaria]